MNSYLGSRIFDEAFYKEIEKGDMERNGKKLYFLKLPTYSRTTDLGGAIDELAYFYFPPDFRKVHWFYEFESFFDRAAGGLKLYKNPEAEPVLAVIDSLEILDPIQSAPGPDNELIRAARAGDVVAVRQAIDKGAKLDASFMDATALSVAAYYGRREVVELLLERGAGIDHADEENGGTPLFMAAKGLEPEIAKILVDRGADVNKRTKDGSSALMMAVCTVQADLASMLIERGADIKAKDEKGLTPFIFAGWSGSLGIARLLIDRGADINVQSDEGTTALMQALSNNNDDVVRLLLEKGAEVSLMSKNGWTALWAAVDKQRPEFVRALIEKGADVKAQRWAPGESWADCPTLLHLALYRGGSEIPKILIEAGTDVNAKNKGGLTPLMRAVVTEQPEIVKLLLEKRADVNAKSQKNMTALKFAKKTKNKEIARMLQAAGAKG